MMRTLVAGALVVAFCTGASSVPKPFASIAGGLEKAT